MAGYTKLFSSILASTIWREDNNTRIVWITMLAMCNKVGVVEGSIPGLADMARVTVEECESALERLKQPDKYSRSQENEGRRIQTIDGGWLVLNYSKYREKMNADERREYNRLKKQEERARNKQVTHVKNKSANVVDVNDSQRQSTNVSVVSTKQIADSKEQIPKSIVIKQTLKLPLGCEGELWQDFRDMRKRIGKPMTMKAEQLIAKKLEKLQMEGHNPVACLENSIANSYQGVFPPNDGQSRFSGQSKGTASDFMKGSTTPPVPVKPEDEEEVASQQADRLLRYTAEMLGVTVEEARARRDREDEEESRPVHVEELEFQSELEEREEIWQD